MLIVAGFLTACGESGADSETAGAEPPDDAFVECMRENGIDLPEGQFQAGREAVPGEVPAGSILTEPPDEMEGIDGEAFAAAREACADLAPEGAVMFGGPGGAGIDESAFRAYRSCMADHGVELPEAGPAGAERGDGAAGAAPPEVSIDRDDPEFAAAHEVCASLLPEVTESAPPTTAA